MRARAGLARCLWEEGKREEALRHCREMLQLNPNDNQGIRYVLMGCLLDMKLDDEASGLVGAYKDDASAHWAYSAALIEFRRAGNGKRSRKLLTAALKHNPFVPAYLLGKKKIPGRLPDTVGFGDESEAVAYAGDSMSAWRGSFGALGWMKDSTSSLGSNKPRRQLK